MLKPPNSLDKSILQDCLNAVQNALYRTLLSNKFEYFSLKEMCKKNCLTGVLHKLRDVIYVKLRREISSKPWASTQKCFILRTFQWHCWAWLRGFNDNAELDSAVSMAPRSLNQRCQCTADNLHMRISPQNRNYISKKSRDTVLWIILLYTMVPTLF